MNTGKVLSAIITSLRARYNAGCYNYRVVDDALRLFLVYRYNEGLTECPTCIYSRVGRLIGNTDVALNSDIKIPLIVSKFSQVKKTGEALLCSLLTANSNQLNFFVDTKGNAYYGGYGLILDKEFKPLLITCNDSIVYPGEGLAFIKKVLKVSERIFNTTNNILEKFIVNRFIPYCTTTSDFDSIEFCNLDHFIQIPQSVEMPYEEMNDSINSFLLNNTEALLRDV